MADTMSHLTLLSSQCYQTVGGCFPCSETPRLLLSAWPELSGSHVKAPCEPKGWEVVWRSVWKPAELKGANNLWESGTMVAWSFQSHDNGPNCLLTFDLWYI